jgi:hypothetical protein
MSLPRTLYAFRAGPLAHLAMSADPNAALKQLVSPSDVSLEDSWDCPEGRTPGEFETNVLAALEPMRVSGRWFAVSPDVLRETVQWVAAGAAPSSFRLVATRQDGRTNITLRRGLSLPSAASRTQMVGSWPLPDHVNPFEATDAVTARVAASGRDTAAEIGAAVRDHVASEPAASCWLIAVISGSHAWVGTTHDVAAAVEQVSVVQRLPARLVSRWQWPDNPDVAGDWWRDHIRSLLGCDQDGFFELPATEQLASAPVTPAAAEQFRAIQAGYVEEAVRQAVDAARAVVFHPLDD